jgi:hypothetical protein
MVQVALLWKFSKTSTKEQLAALLLGLAYSAACCLLPMGHRYLLHAVNDIIIIYSGGLQVLETYRVKHTGAQSIVTTSMNLIGELLRIFTTVEEAKADFNMLLNFGFCATLSVIMFGQYFWYQKNTERFYERQQQKNHDGTDCGAVYLGSGDNDNGNDNDNDNHMLPPESLTDIQGAIETAVCSVEGRVTRRRKSGT